MPGRQWADARTYGRTDVRSFIGRRSGASDVRMQIEKEGGRGGKRTQERTNREVQGRAGRWKMVPEIGLKTEDAVKNLEG